VALKAGVPAARIVRHAMAEVSRTLSISEDLI
jgi:hypothetical protein